MCTLCWVHHLLTIKFVVHFVRLIFLFILTPTQTLHHCVMPLRTLHTGNFLRKMFIKASLRVHIHDLPFNHADKQYLTRYSFSLCAKNHSISIPLYSAAESPLMLIHLIFDIFTFLSFNSMYTHNNIHAQNIAYSGVFICLVKLDFIYLCVCMRAYTLLSSSYTTICQSAASDCVVILFNSIAANTHTHIHSHPSVNHKIHVALSIPDRSIFLTHFCCDHMII